MSAVASVTASMASIFIELDIIIVTIEILMVMIRIEGIPIIDLDILMVRMATSLSFFLYLLGKFECLSPSTEQGKNSK
jgi:hypothetical protein